MSIQDFQNNFKQEVLKVVRRIPKGSVLTYKEVAIRAGSPGAARVVGNIMAANRDKTVPCHRVIRSDGTIGGYNGLQGTKSKRKLLEQEGAL